jgi:hypothetical protein
VATFRIGFGLLVGLVVVVLAAVDPSPRHRAATWHLAVTGRESVLVRGAPRFRAGAVRRFWLGEGYRDLWTAPVTVQVFDLTIIAGGLVATKVGGGLQTRSLRLETADGREYVFRLVSKDARVLHAALRGTPVEYVVDDALSQSHPAAPLIVPPFLRVAGVLHPTPALGVLPDDERLGIFRREFAGLLGMLEEYPSVAADGAGFARAVEIIDSDELFWRMSQDPHERVDTRVLLAARLVDGLLNDNDRHEGQWKWARLSSEPYAPWVPIPRDRDRVLVSFDGALHGLVRALRPDLVRFDARYPSPVALFRKARLMDERLLVGLEKRVWDSVATALTRAIDDSVIDAALHSVPPEYRGMNARLRAKLVARRDSLGAFAERYRRHLERVVRVNP